MKSLKNKKKKNQQKELKHFFKSSGQSLKNLMILKQLGSNYFVNNVLKSQNVGKIEKKYMGFLKKLGQCLIKLIDIEVISK